MSSKPVSTIIRSDAPHLVEVKPGSLNASSTKSWVEAGEVHPDDLIEVQPMPHEGEHRVSAGEDLHSQDDHQSIPSDALDDHRAHLDHSAPGASNRVQLEDSAMASHHEPIVDASSVDHRTSVPDQGGVHDHHVAVSNSPESGLHVEPGLDESIHDHHAPLPNGSDITDHHESMARQAIHDHHVLLPGHDAAHDPQAPLAHEGVNTQEAETGNTPPSGRFAEPAPSEQGHPSAHPHASVAGRSHLHITQDPTAFMSRVAAIRESVSHVNGQLDEIKK